MSTQSDAVQHNFKASSDTSGWNLKVLRSDVGSLTSSPSRLGSGRQTLQLAPRSWTRRGFWTELCGWYGEGWRVWASVGSHLQFANSLWLRSLRVRGSSSVSWEVAPTLCHFLWLRRDTLPPVGRLSVTVLSWRAEWFYGACCEETSRFAGKVGKAVRSTS